MLEESLSRLLIMSEILSTLSAFPFMLTPKVLSRCARTKVAAGLSEACTRPARLRLTHTLPHSNKELRHAGSPTAHQLVVTARVPISLQLCDYQGQRRLCILPLALLAGPSSPLRTWPWQKHGGERFRIRTLIGDW